MDSSARQPATRAGCRRCLSWRLYPSKPVQIAVRPLADDLQLRRLLWGKTALFDGVSPLTNLLRARHSLCVWCEALECGSLLAGWEWCTRSKSREQARWRKAAASCRTPEFRTECQHACFIPHCGAAEPLVSPRLTVRNLDRLGSRNARRKTRVIVAPFRPGRADRMWPTALAVGESAPYPARPPPQGRKKSRPKARA